MAKFDLEKYWDFRVWVKSQIAQLRALLNEYQQNGGGGGTGGGSGSSDFNPAGTYPNLTAGKATKADTATRATNADKATKATSATTAESAKTAMNADSATTAGYATTAGVAESTEHATTADFATDLTGRREATPEVFTYRPSAGEQSIKDDNAFIRRVKGNSVVWNQLVHGSTYPNTVNRYGLECSVKLNSREITVVGTYANDASTTDRNWYTANALTQLSTGIVGHIYLCRISGNKECSLTLYGWCAGTTDIFDTVILECTSATTLNIALKLPLVSDGIQINETIIVDIHDLTAMFGAGNEPTAEEFRALFPNSGYPYNTGELRNLVCSGIKTVGFNEFNGTYAQVLPNESYYLGGAYTSIGFATEIGGTITAIAIPNNRLYTPTSVGYIYATGTDICINLHHTGYRDGEYAPYKEVTHALPLSQITNGEPLRKAGGDVYDEVNNDYYIRRVGVRSYTTGDKDDAALLTDGTHTNYPLDEPIYTPINTPIDFNYYVEDFGTEEALLQEDSAPFSADIVYQFNATDQIRNNYRNIQWLKKSAFVPSGTAAQYIRGDGSYGDVTELSHGTPIHDGEYEMPDEGDYDMQFTLTPSYYAKSPRELDDTTTIAVFVTAPDDSNYLAEYWFEFAVGETLPNIEYYQPNNSDAVFRINGNLMTYAVNVLHLISSDGGITFYGEIKNYSI